jgi:hypothetical protein
MDGFTRTPFAMPAPQQSRTQKIGEMLMGFGAGFEGRGQEFLSARDARQQQLDERRQKAMAQDAMRVYSSLSDGKYDDAIELIDDRVKAINELGGDASDTLEIRNLIVSGRLDEAQQELGGFLELAMANGLIEAPKAPEIVPASSMVNGQVVTRDSAGNLMAQTPVGMQSQQQGFRMLSPQEVEAQGLDQSQRYQVDQGTGRVAPIGGGGGVVTNVNLPPAADEATTAFGKSIGERASARIETAANAVGQNENLMRMAQSIGQGASTGLGQETLLNLQNFAQSIFGIPVSEAASEQEVIRALGNRLVMEVRNPTSGMGLPGATSNRDLDFLTASVPGLAKTPQGNALLIEYLMKQNQFKQDIANEQQRIIDDNGGVVPSNLDTRLMRYANDYQFADDEFRREVEEALKIADSPAVATGRFIIEVVQ